MHKFYLIEVIAKVLRFTKMFQFRHPCESRDPFFGIFAISLIVFISVTSAFSIEKSSIARFHRILKLFEYPVYSVSDRDISGHFQYSTDDNKNIPREEDIIEEAMNHETFSREIKGDLGFTGTWMKSSVLNNLTNITTGFVNCGYKENASVNVHPLLGIYDSIEEKDRNQSIYIRNQLFWNRHFKTNALKDHPFIGVHGNVTYMLDRAENEHFEISNRNSYYRDFQKSIKRNLDLNAEIAPVAGLGRMRPVRPVYQAFEIERHLRRCKSITAPLSDQTMLNLATFSSSIKASKLRYDLYRKNFMKKIEQILKEDPGVCDSLLDAYSLFKIYEVFETDYPLLTTGVSGYLKCEITGGYQRTRSIVKDQIYRDFEPTFFQSEGSFEYQTSCVLSIAYPVINRLFLSVMITDPFMPQLTGAFYLLLTNRLFIESGINANWNRHYKNTFVNGYCDIKLYIEDRISIDCLLKRSVSRSVNHANNITIDDRKQIEGITLGLNYDF